MQRNILMKVAPRGANGPEVKYLSSAAASGSGVYLEGQQWLPCIVDWPTLDVSFVTEGVLDKMTIKHGDLSFRMAPAYQNQQWSALDWSHAEASIYVGHLSDAFTDYVQTYQGAVSSIDRDGITATISLLGPEAALDKPLLTLSYLGTGGAEGPESRTGTLKPWCSGDALSIAPTLVDSAYWVYQVHGYGPVHDIPVAYEFAQALAPAVTNVATYKQLIALDLTPGQWAKCLPLGMFRLGGAPNKKVSCDVLGAVFDGVYASSLSQIVRHLLVHAGVFSTSIGDLSQFDDVDWNFFASNQITIGEVVRDALRQAGGYLLPDGRGVWQVGNFFAPKPAKQLRRDRSSAPLVVNIKSPPESAPVYKVVVAYDRCWATHGSGEVADTAAETIKEVKDAIKNGGLDGVNAIRDELPNLVLPLLQKPIDDLAALQLRYGAAQIKATDALHKEALVAINETRAYVDENGNKIAQNLIQLTTKFDGQIGGVKGEIASGLTDLKKTIANAGYASSEQVLKLIAIFGDDVEAAFVAERRIRVSKEEALAEDIKEMGVTFSDEIDGERTTREGQITDIDRLIIDKDRAMGERVDEMGVRITTEVGEEKTQREAAIRDVQQVIIDETTGLISASEVNELVARVDRDIQGERETRDAAIRDTRKVQVDENEARATETRNLQSRLNNVNGAIGASFESKFETVTNELEGAKASWTFKVQSTQNGVPVFGGIGQVAQNGYVSTAITTDLLTVYTPNGFEKLLEISPSGGLQVRKAVIGTIEGSNLKVTNASIDNLTISGDKFEPSAVTSVSGFERNYGGWHLTNRNWNYVGGSASDTPYGIVGTGNSQAAVIIDVVGTFARDGGDDDNLDVTLQRFDINGNNRYLSTRSVQVQSSNRPFAFKWVDFDVGNNNRYTYYLVQRATGNDGSPYWYDVTLSAVAYKK